MGISEATLRRVEQGDPGTGAATHLTALWVLGVLDTAVPLLDPLQWSTGPGARARTFEAQGSDDYF